jgi:hypothetical protein
MLDTEDYWAELRVLLEEITGVLLACFWREGHEIVQTYSLAIGSH